MAEEHLKDCPNIKFKCKLCRSIVTRENTMEHESFECVKNIQLRRKDIEEELKESRVENK